MTASSLVPNRLFHTNGFSTEKAKKLQLSLSKKVVREDRLPERINYVAGVDVAYTDGYAIGAVAVLEYDTLKTVETRTSFQAASVPYIPTFLSFREIPHVVSAINMLSIRPDVFLVDGHGFAHPRRLGFASHLGLVVDAVTVGVAKSLLCGEIVKKETDGWKPIMHEKLTVGAAVYARPSVKPVYVSIGHKISLETAIEIVKHCMKNYRIPEPIREAHKAAIERKMQKLS
jgi:deoxyribonuclease V